MKAKFLNHLLNFCKPMLSGEPLSLVSEQFCPKCGSSITDYVHDFTMERECYNCGNTWGKIALNGWCFAKGLCTFAKHVLAAGPFGPDAFAKHHPLAASRGTPLGAGLAANTIITATWLNSLKNKHQTHGNSKELRKPSKLDGICIT